MTTPLQSYFPLAVVFLASGGLAALLLGAALLFGPRRPSKVKSSPFECGSIPIGDARQRFGVKFYVVALLFIVFDIDRGRWVEPILRPSFPRSDPGGRYERPRPRAMSSE